MREPRHIMAEHVERHDFRRPHPSLDYATPAEWYLGGVNSSNAPADKMTKWAA